MKFLSQSIAEGSCLLNLDARSMEEIVRAAVQRLVQTGRLPESQQDLVIDGVLRRERQVPTAIGHAAAVPHFYDDAIGEPAMVFVRLTHAVNLGAPDGIATRYIFLLLGSTHQTTLHLDALSSIARMMSDNVFHFELTYAKKQQDVLDAMGRHVDRCMLTIPPKPREVTAGLRTPAVPMAGIIGDLRRRLPSYLDEFRAGLRLKSLATILFMFFACLAPAVTFGGLMGAETNGSIGAPEMLVSTAVCGLIYAVLAGQPLIILGGIGPLLVFTIILYQLCQDMGLAANFLGVYGWVGLWTAVMTVVLAVTNASNLMKYFTRFTDEIFSTLMSLIFVYKAIEGVVETFQKSDGHGSVTQEKALLALVLAAGTFYIAISLARFRSSKYLVPWVREFLSDFGPSIALGAMIGAAWWLGDASTLDTLQVDTTAILENSEASQSWTVDLAGVPNWLKLATAGPAALAAVLVFLSQNITARLVNSPENKMRSCESYHWDLAVIGVLIGGCSVLGWPWMVAATVRSLAHVRAVANIEEVVQMDGNTKEEIIHVNVNRVTGIAIHVLIAATLFILPLLELVPLAALYGVFLFMGVVSLRGIQFMERLGLWLTDSALYPVNHYTRCVPIQTIHLFTLVQFTCLAVLCVINFIPYEPVQILFPVFIAALVPVRWMLGRFFSKEHLAFLDADEVPDEEGTHWV